MLIDSALKRAAKIGRKRISYNIKGEGNKALLKKNADLGCLFLPSTKKA
jgi:hypothetical protein